MNTSENQLTKDNLKHLEHCLSLAEEALNAGDEPFGSILVDANDNVIATARNRVNELNNLAHPEIELAHWAAENIPKNERKKVTMYTTGEHCPMCAAAHGWVGIGKLVYLSSGEQLNEWLKEFGAEAALIKFIPVEKIIKKVEVKGPVTGRLLDEIKKLHQTYHQHKK